MSGWRWRLRRIAAVMRLETQLLRRDRPTLSLILLVPAIQILLFGAAVNLNPTHLTLAVTSATDAQWQMVSDAARASGYFTTIVRQGNAAAAVREGKSHIAVEWPAEGPPRLSADGTDPAATRPAALALAVALQRAQVLSLAPLLDTTAPTIDWLYNPEAHAAWSITPALAGVVVMISTLLLGALTLVREREQGHWESLLATAVDGTDVLLGKLSPYVVAGVMQALIVAGVSWMIFDVPFKGSLLLFLAATTLFAAAHLLFGFALSALAVNQLQAIQSAVFFYLPAMLLSGFMFPFAGMPRWAQWIGECIPLTHFVRVTRGIQLKGSGFGTLWPDLWPIGLFALAAAAIALTVYRRHL